MIVLHGVVTAHPGPCLRDGCCVRRGRRQPSRQPQRGRSLYGAFARVPTMATDYPSTSAPSTVVRPFADLGVTTEDVEAYEKIGRIGEGTYGRAEGERMASRACAPTRRPPSAIVATPSYSFRIVYKARHRMTGEIVALKRVRVEDARDGLPVTAARELRVLATCRHPNVVALRGVAVGARVDSVFLAFECCEHDLARLVDELGRPFATSEVKCLLAQLLRALVHLHDRWVVHRDVKLSNLLLRDDGSLKLCDFGLARYFRAYRVAYTPGVVTLWYRAPEILLGDDAYTEAIDLWAVGCVLGELLLGGPLFPGQTVPETLGRIAVLLGDIDPATWPGAASLPGGRTLPPPRSPPARVEDVGRVFPGLSREGCDLLLGLLAYDPDRRLTAREALRHPWFREAPAARPPESMPTFPSTQGRAAERARGGRGR